MGPGDQAFVRWAKRYITADDAVRVLRAYKKADLIAVDNREGTFRVLDHHACSRDAFESAAENLRPPGRRRGPGWNRLSEEERQRMVSSKRSVPEQWERQERIELAMLKLDLKHR